MSLFFCKKNKRTVTQKILFTISMEKAPKISKFVGE